MDIPPAISRNPLLTVLMDSHKDSARGCRLQVVDTGRRRWFGACSRPQGSWSSMIPVPSGFRVYPSTGVTDMRRGLPGLSLQVQQALGRDPHADDLEIERLKAALAAERAASPRRWRSFRGSGRGSNMPGESSPAGPARRSLSRRHLSISFPAALLARACSP